MQLETLLLFRRLLGPKKYLELQSLPQSKHITQNNQFILHGEVIPGFHENHN